MRLSIAANALFVSMTASATTGRGAHQSGRRQMLQTLKRGTGDRMNKMDQLQGAEGAHGKSKYNGFFDQFDRTAAVVPNREDPVECNPNSEDVDIGILSCGVGLYCMESEATSLGGICTEELVQRELQSLPSSCNETDPYFGVYFECDCTGFDPYNSTGIISCASDVYCDPVTTSCGFVSYIGYYEFDSGYNVYIGCYNYVYPYYQQVCTAYANYAAPGECAITFNGEVCNSCFANSNSSYSNYTCLEFDCTNTCGAHAGSQCEGDSLVLINDPNKTQVCTTLPPSTMAPATPAPATAAPVTSAPVVPTTPAPVDPPDPTPAPVETPVPTDESTDEPVGSGVTPSTLTNIPLLGLSLSLLAYLAE